MAGTGIPVVLRGISCVGKEILQASMAKKDGLSPGPLVYTEPRLDFNPEFHPFLHPTFGIAMNQNVTFGGTPEKIHNGGTSTEWTGTAIAGTWNFADAGKTSITAANDNDQADFANVGTSVIDLDVFTALTGKVNLTTYTDSVHSITISFTLAGVLVGNTVELEGFIDTSVLGTEQSFAISKSVFGITDQDVDGFTILITRSGGAKPTMAFDDLQIEETGSPAEFKSTTPLGTRFHISEIRIRIEDAFDSTLANATIPNIPFNTILGVSALANGIVFKRVQAGITLFSVTLKDLGDFLATGSNLTNVTGDAGDTGFTLVVEFPEAIVLIGSLEDDFLSFTINDNLSELSRFTAAARGGLEI